MGVRKRFIAPGLLTYPNRGFASFAMPFSASTKDALARKGQWVDVTIEQGIGGHLASRSYAISKGEILAVEKKGGMVAIMLTSLEKNSLVLLVDGTPHTLSEGTHLALPTGQDSYADYIMIKVLFIHHNEPRPLRGLRLSSLDVAMAGDAIINGKRWVVHRVPGKDIETRQALMQGNFTIHAEGDLIVIRPNLEQGLKNCSL